MKWTYGIRNKMIFALLLSVILTVVVINNRAEKRKIAELGDTFSSVYNDRLMVENYIFQLSNLIHRKKSFIENNDRAALTNAGNYMSEQNAEIDQLLVKYEGTVLTESEITIFNEFKKMNASVVRMEEEIQVASASLPQRMAEIDNWYLKSLKLLNTLSEIQVAEGKNLHDNSRKILMSNASSSQFEMALVIIIGMIIQALLFTTRSVVPKYPESSSMLN